MQQSAATLRLLATTIRTDQVSGDRSNHAPFACQSGLVETSLTGHDRIPCLVRNTYNMKKGVTGKNLTEEAPRSPRIRVGGYAILGRTIDTCRALVTGNIGEYQFDCPLDNMLFGFKGVKGDDFKVQIEQGASDQEIVEWLNRTGQKKTPDEIHRWSDEVDANGLCNSLEKCDFFDVAKKLRLDPVETTTFFQCFPP